MGVHRWLVLSLSCSLLLAAALPARGEVPGLLHYQGYLTDVEGTPVSGTWTLSFQFYAQQTGGAAFFTESQVVEPEVGVFSVILGSQPGNTIDPEDFEGGTAWLGVVADDGVAEPVTLQPRQRVASHPYALRTGSAATCGEATNALSLGGVAASDYAMVAAMDGFLTADDLPDLLASLGIVPGGGYGDADVAAYLAVNGFGPGPYFNGSYLSLTNLPDLSQYLTDADLAGFVVTEDLLDQVAASGLFLMADGSVVATGDLDLGGNQLLDVVIENASAADAPETPAAGQLWFDTTSATLKVFDGATWTPLGSGLAADLACQGCVGAEDVSFGYAASPGKGGAALSAMDLVCSGCIEESDLGVSWALGESPGGAAVSALSAEDLDCTGCVTLGHIDAGTLDAGNLPYADPTGLGVSTVEEALSALDGKIEEGGLGGVVHEGNGTVLPYVEQWGLPSYGKARTYLHLMNPAQPKVVTYLYGEEGTSYAAGADSLVVAYEFKPNKYTKILSAVQGQLSIQVENPSLVSPGSHLLLHQTVGTGGNGTGSGAWELVQAVTVEGTSVIVSKPLTRTYTSCGAACGFAQAVVATSYNQLEVVSGGAIRPSSALGTNGEQYGGIVYVRARKITVKTGGLIEADAAGFLGGDSSQSPAMEKGHSGCSAANDTNFATSPNCGGGGGGGFNGSGYTGGGGGGGNGTAGAAGTGSQPGAGGTQVGSADLATLQFGGGGGGYSHSAGTGGGIVLLGAESVVVETGGIIRANGSAGSGCTSTTHSGAGGGAGGTIAIFASQYMNSGTVQATGGAGGSGPPGNGGNGGTGWVVNKPPVPGIVNESFAKGVQIWVDGVNVTPLVGDPNAKGPPHWDPVSKSWGTTGLAAWSTGPLDLTVVANWTLGEHALEVRETGGSGGDLKLYAYVIYPFSEATAPSHDTCAAPKVLNVMGGAVVTSDTTEDTMGKIKANDDSVQPFCGGSSGPDVVYRMDLTDWRKLTVSVSAPFIPRTYIRKDSCASGQLVACGAASLATDVLKPGTYYLWVDGDGNLQKGNFTLTVTPGLPGPPSNDSCASPAALTFTNGTSSAYGMNLFSSNDYSASCGGGEGLDNVYMFSVPAGTAQLSLSLAAAFQPVLYLGHGACTGPFIACAPSSSYSLGWPEPGTYYVVVDGKTAADKGEYTLTITLQ